MDKVFLSLYIVSSKVLKLGLAAIFATGGTGALLFHYHPEPFLRLASLPDNVVVLPSETLTPTSVPVVSPAQDKASSTTLPTASYPLVSPLTNVGLPARLIIPVIGVNAKIEQVGRTAAGAMDVPKDPMNAGWYTLNARPGEEGSAVIDGHVDWYFGQTGVFKRLSSLKVGDHIKVQDDAGKVISFVVRKRSLFGPKSNASTVFGSSDGGAHLNLITCSGVWDKTAHSYTQRLVVFADLAIGN